MAYAGMKDKHVAFGRALILDEVARHWRDLDEQCRGRIFDSCEALLGRRVPELGHGL